MDWLHFVGNKYYPNEEEFASEAEQYGVSRRIDKRMMQQMNFGDRVFLFQKIKGRDYSKMFGQFTIDRVMGSGISEMIKALKKEGKVKDSNYEEREVYRRCGLYKITAEHDVEVSIPEITEKMTESGVRDAMVGGEFQRLEGIYSEISFQQGFRPFNHNEFEEERQKGVEEGKRDGTTKTKRVKGYFYDEVEEPEEPPKNGKILEVENYVQRPVSEHLNTVFEEHRKEFIAGEFAMESIPRDKLDITIPKQEKSFLVDVFYGTDRKKADEKDVNNFYGSKRSKLQYGICSVHIPPEIHEVGKVERPHWWKLEFSEDPDKHFMIMSILPKRSGQFKKLLHNKVQSSDDKDAFIFVHGYNVNFAAAAMRTAQIAFDLGFKGAPMMFSWPSRGKLMGYLGDKDNVEYAIPHLAEFLEKAIKWSKAERMHVIAHSMGNVCLTEAILKVSETFRDRLVFNNIILAAPDIDRDIFVEQIAPAMTACPECLKRITLYASSKDRALNISKMVRFNKVPRAGEAGEKIVLMDGIDTIDASAVNTDFLGHGYIANAPELIEDLTALIKEEPPPSHKERNLREKVKDKIKYWLFTRRKKKKKIAIAPQPARTLFD